MWLFSVVRRAHDGFSLIELIAVLIILGVVAFVTVPRFSSVNSALQSGRDDTVAALFFARQIAMARDSAANPVRFVVTSSSLSVTENGVPLLYGGTQYPLTLPAGVSFATATVFEYDKLGRIAVPSDLSLSEGSNTLVVQVSESGYAR